MDRVRLRRNVSRGEGEDDHAVCELMRARSERLCVRRCGVRRERERERQRECRWRAGELGECARTDEEGGRGAARRRAGDDDHDHDNAGCIARDDDGCECHRHQAVERHGARDARRGAVRQDETVRERPYGRADRREERRRRGRCAPRAGQQPATQGHVLHRRPRGRRPRPREPSPRRELRCHGTVARADSRARSSAARAAQPGPAGVADPAPDATFARSGLEAGRGRGAGRGSDLRCARRTAQEHPGVRAPRRDASVHGGPAVDPRPGGGDHDRHGARAPRNPNGGGCRRVRS